jgi:hypothetical protein
MTKRKTTRKLPPFVAISWAMLNHRAYIDLPPTAKGTLPYFLGKVKVPSTDPSYHHNEFSFTFSEAEKYGCARRSFYRVISALMDHGFIDPVRKGGRSGGRDTASLFRLSRRWEKYGTLLFEKVRWAEFGTAQIQRQVQNWHSPVARNTPQRNREAKSACQK